MSAKQPPITPDARYILIRGRLWRATNPTLAKAKREKFVKALMVSRRAIRDAKTGSAAMASARRAVEHAKRGLGERGPVQVRRTPSTLVLVQDEHDIQFGMDVSLWLFPAEPEISVPLAY